MYEIMNKLFAGKSGPKVKVGQLLFSNLIISPVMNSGKKKVVFKEGDSIYQLYHSLFDCYGNSCWCSIS